MDIEVEFVATELKKVRGRTSVDLSPPHAPPTRGDPAPFLSLGKRLECRKRGGEKKTLKRKGRGALNVCVRERKVKAVTDAEQRKTAKSEGRWRKKKRPKIKKKYKK